MILLLLGAASIAIGSMLRIYWTRTYQTANEEQDPFARGVARYHETRVRLLSIALPWLIGPIFVLLGILDLVGVFG